MEAIIKECQKGSLKNIINPAVVIASGECGGIQKAKNSGIPVFIIKRDVFASGVNGQEAFGQAILSVLRKLGINIVTQNGWLPLTPTNVIKAFKNRIFNQHPGPLDPPHPDFGGKGMWGLRVHGAVLYFSKMINRKFTTEATAQYVFANYDCGSLLLKQPVSVEKTDTPEVLAKRVLPFEHRLQIKLLKLFAENQLKILTRKTNLIKENEIGKLNIAKLKAISDYPKG